MRKITLLFTSLLLCANCFAQSSFKQSKFWGDIEVSAGMSLESLSDNYGICVPRNNLTTSFLLSAGYYVCPRLSLGVSTGVSSFCNPDLSFIPIFFDVKVKPFSFDLVTDLKLGSQLLFSGDKYFKQGFCGGLFVGYPVLRKRLFHITPGIEYSYTGFSVKNNNGIASSAFAEYVSGSRNAFAIKLMIGFGGK